jgi:hypothetical protein
MASYKRIGGNYTIESIGGNVTIVGNLVVTGNSTSVTSTNTSVTDSIITLNKGESGSGVTTVYAGIEIDRGSAANVQLRWNEAYDRWQITSDGTTFANIATSAGATTLANIYADSAPAISANLDLRGHTIWDSTTNATVLTLSTVGGAGSGVYATPTGESSAELVTQSKALAYAIIFG